MSAAAPSYLRTALSPRMLGVLLGLLAAAAGCVRLGIWQFERAQPREVSMATVPLVEVLEPQATFPGDLGGRSVVARGTFGDDQLLVPDDGGYRVLTPLRVGDAWLPVVRGWTAHSAPPPPEGVVEVTGWLQPGERGGDPALPGQINAVSPAELVNIWGGPIYSGYLVLEDAQPGLTTVAAPALRGPVDLQNLGYALQWWVFAGFAVLLWVRMVRDRAQKEHM